MKDVMALIFEIIPICVVALITVVFCVAACEQTDNNYITSPKGCCGECGACPDSVVPETVFVLDTVCPEDSTDCGCDGHRHQHGQGHHKHGECGG